MSTTTSLILAGEGWGVSISPEAEAQKLELIEKASVVTTVNDNATADAARAHVKSLAAMRNLVEKSRKAIKEPVLQVGRDIDARAAEFVADLVGHEKRLSGLIGDHAAEIERKRQEALREQRRIEAEAAEAQRRADQQRAAEEAARAKAAADAEAARLQAEREAAAADDDDIDAQIAAAEAIDAANAARKKSADEAEASRQAEVARQAEADRRAAEARQASLVAHTQATSGVKFEYEFSVTDIHALYAAHPTFVSIAVRTADVKAYLKQQTGEPSLPGLLITKKPVVSTR
jgi:hypothetical protein